MSHGWLSPLTMGTLQGMLLGLGLGSPQTPSCVPGVPRLVPPPFGAQQSPSQGHRGGWLGADKGKGVQSCPSVMRDPSRTGGSWATQHSQGQLQPQLGGLQPWVSATCGLGSAEMEQFGQSRSSRAVWHHQHPALCLSLKQQWRNEASMTNNQRQPREKQGQVPLPSK